MSNLAPPLTLLLAGYALLALDALVPLAISLRSVGAIVLFLGLLLLWRRTDKSRKVPRRFLVAGMLLIWAAHSFIRVGNKTLAREDALIMDLLKGLAMIAVGSLVIHLSAAIGLAPLLRLPERALFAAASLAWLLWAIPQIGQAWWPTTFLGMAHDEAVLRALELAGDAAAGVAVGMLLVRARRGA